MIWNVLLLTSAMHPAPTHGKEVLCGELNYCVARQSAQYYAGGESRAQNANHQSVIEIEPLIGFAPNFDQICVGYQQTLSRREILKKSYRSKIMLEKQLAEKSVFFSTAPSARIRFPAITYVPQLLFWKRKGVGTKLKQFLRN